MANYTAKLVHKEIFPATYNFRDDPDSESGDYYGTHSFDDEAVGTEDTDIEPITLIGGGDSNRLATVEAINDGHNKVVKFVSDGDNGTFAYWYHQNICYLDL